MKPGNNLILYYFSLSNFKLYSLLRRHHKFYILVNIEKIKPSFEEPKEEFEKFNPSQTLKVKLKKKKRKKIYKSNIDRIRQNNS